jgi:transcriptional regulator of acetoin/glycerol metabolism
MYANSWERFVETGSFDGVRLPIAASWERSAAAAGNVIPLHQSFDSDSFLVDSARGVLRATEDALGGTTSWIALTDEHGVVTYEWSSSGELKRRLDRSSLSIGSVLAENVAGTNGVGLALATRAPSAVRGTEHFNPDWHGLVCAAAPLLHPVTGEQLGVMNVTSLVSEQNQHLGTTLRRVVDGIRDSLSSGLRSHHQHLLDAHLRVKNASFGTVVTLDANTMIVEGDAAALGIDRAQLWQLIEQAGSSTRELVLPSLQRVRLVFVDRSDLAAGCSVLLNGTASSIDATKLPGSPARRLGPIEQAERDVIAAVLREVDGNKTLAAERLRISRGTLYERLRRYELHGS